MPGGVFGNNEHHVEVSGIRCVRWPDQFLQEDHTFLERQRVCNVRNWWTPCRWLFRQRNVQLQPACFDFSECLNVQKLTRKMCLLWMHRRDR